MPYVACPGATTKLRTNPTTLPPRRSTHNVGGLPTRGTVFSHRSTVGNLHRTLRERVLFSTRNGVMVPTLQPVGRYATPGMLHWRNRVTSLLDYTSPLNHSEFCEKQSGLKKQRYVTAKNNILCKGDGCVDASVTGFLKPEKYTTDAAPRLISPRTPEYLLETGCYLEPLEKKLYRAIAEVEGYECIMKGFNLGSRARVMASHWDAFTHPVAIGLDASKFDQHVSQSALRYEHSFYLRAFQNDPKLQRLLAGQLLNAVTCRLEDGIVRWTSRGGRMSGDMNTALGNCLLSASMLTEWARLAGVNMRCVIDGDDCVAFMEACDEERFLRGLPEWYALRGFRMKVEDAVYSFEDIEFCQCHPVWLTNGWMLVRNPVKAITQDHVWIERGGITHREVLTATGEGGVCLYGDCPVLGAYYRMLRGTGGLTRAAKREMAFRRSWMRHLSGERAPAHVTERARVSFGKAFGIAPTHQVLLEEYFSSFDLLGALANNKQTANYDINDLSTYLGTLVPLFANFKY